MNIWQISPFRYDENSQQYWSKNCINGVIGIGWSDLGDLRKFKSKEELRKALKEKYPYSDTDRNWDVESCWQFCNEIKEGNIIVSKKGNSKSIYGIGIVEKEYDFYDEPIDDFLDNHIIKVKWIVKFIDLINVPIKKGFVQWTVHKLEQETFDEIINFVEIDHEKSIENLPAEAEDLEVIEGRKEYHEVLWRSRNHKIIDEKKSGSDYTCEICKFNFRDKYGKIGENYIVVHHLNPVGQREDATSTKLEDLILVCDNCHRMLHRGPPYKPEELVKMMK